jgi:hypothetical protein
MMFGLWKWRSRVETPEVEIPVEESTMLLNDEMISLTDDLATLQGHIAN